jgi:ubiquinone/menaquinone biosynthesis C-methylase UbiE
MKATHQTFIPAAGHDLLLPLYDPLTVLLGFARIRLGLLQRAKLAPGERVLDVGCGTGTLLVAVLQAHPNVEAIGLDPDPKALARAERKLRRAGVSARLTQGSASAMPFDAGRFGCVLSSFMFHHLDAPTQRAMLSEVHRVLEPGGRLELMDFAGKHARGHGPLGRFRLMHAGLEEDVVIASLQHAGFDDVQIAARDSSWFGPVVHYQAKRGSGMSS